MTEKRVQDRVAIDLSLHLVVEGRSIVATSRDISVSGLRVALGEELPFGTKVKVHIRLPALPGGSVIDAEVRWSKTEVGGGFCAGLQLLRVRARETWALN